MKWYMVCFLTLILVSGCVSTKQFNALESQIDQNTDVMVQAINQQAQQLNKMRVIEQYNTRVMDCYMNDPDPSPETKNECIKTILDEIKNAGGADDAKVRENDLPGQPGQAIQGAVAGSPSTE